jgi:uncharacterized protein (TIGR02301 family)
MMKTLTAAGLALALWASPAHAQAPRDVSSGENPHTYADDLAALSHVLGSAHYIRRLCSGRADQRWREQMRKFMDLEGPPGTPQRSMMVQQFNEGYREQEQRFPACTPDAQAYEATLKTMGARLATGLAARYRN